MERNIPYIMEIEFMFQTTNQIYYIAYELWLAILLTIYWLYIITTYLYKYIFIYIYTYYMYTHYIYIYIYLVGGFNPSEKYESS